MPSLISLKSPGVWCEGFLGGENFTRVFTVFFFFKGIPGTIVESISGMR